MDTLIGYLAPDGFLPQLLEELGGQTIETHGRLVLASKPPAPVAWVANRWLSPQRIEIASIGDAAKKLRAIQRNWMLYPHAHHRRAALIEAKLPAVSAKPFVFGNAAPQSPLGSWMLLEPSIMLASAHCSSPFAHGEPNFVEDREAPPSRAYLKLWEVFTLLGIKPVRGDVCLDLGSSPGGWTWVLQSLGASVISVDKAPLDSRVAGLPNVEHRLESAFALGPSELGPVDWLFCDVICYPARLLALVRKWLAAGTVRRFVCTIKFQGATDTETARAFAAIPGAKLMHLSNNKHELTWVLS